MGLPIATCAVRGASWLERAVLFAMVLAALLLLLLLGLWLFHEIKGYLKIEACVEAGFRNCGATEQ